MTPIEFKHIRKGLGLTQLEMARALKVTRKTVVNWENEIFRLPSDIALMMAENGVGAVPTLAPKNAALTRDTIKYYGEMRRDGIPHARIVALWASKNFVPTPEAQAGILANWPDILENNQSCLSG